MMWQFYAHEMTMLVISTKFLIYLLMGKLKLRKMKYFLLEYEAIYIDLFVVTHNVRTAL
jgi:hypothetical protein